METIVRSWAAPQGRVRRDGLEHFGVAVVGELIDDLARKVVPFGAQHPHGGNSEAASALISAGVADVMRGTGIG